MFTREITRSSLWLGRDSLRQRLGKLRLFHVHMDFLRSTSPAAISGCRQCHGSEVKSLGQGKFDAATWPNSGIGRRVNPDGSKGSCAACHCRHTFSSAQVRQPENCGKGHMGPDHPQIEIYNESKHGIQFRVNVAKMNLDAHPWVVGKDYSAAPTCATCHMSATANQKVTHDGQSLCAFGLAPLQAGDPQLQLLTPMTCSHR